VQFFEAELINSEGLDDVAAFATIFVELIDLSGYPVVRWHVVVDSVNHVRQVRKSQFITFSARDDIAVLALEVVEMRLGESRQGGAGIRAHQTVGAWTRTKAR